MIKLYRFIFVTGKGGVGGTTISAALACIVSSLGRRTLLATSHSADMLSAIFEVDLGSGVFPWSDHLHILAVDPRASRREYGRLELGDNPVFRAVFDSTWVNRFLDAIPGLSEWAILGKVTHHALLAMGSPEAYDTVVFDAPPTGHALEMLRLPGLIAHIFPSGRLHEESEKRISLLGDPDRCLMVLVAAPEDLPAKEAEEAAKAVRRVLGVDPGFLVINHVTPNPFSSEEAALIEAWPPEQEECALHVGLGRSRVRRCRREGRVISDLASRFSFPSAIVLQQPCAVVDSKVLHRIIPQIQGGLSGEKG